MSSYNFNQHKHNYAVWTAARAAQRGFTTTKNIKFAIEISGLQKFAESESGTTNEEFEIFHKMCCNKIKASLDEKLPVKTTYGRAAKIIAIYLKTSVVIANQATCARSKIIHPPIDDILLRNLSLKKELTQIKNKRWTLLSESEYWDLVNKIKSVVHLFDWTLEEFWSPEIEK
jgi:hypothetical protein